MIARLLAAVTAVAIGTGIIWYGVHQARSDVWRPPPGTRIDYPVTPRLPPHIRRI